MPDLGVPGPQVSREAGRKSPYLRQVRSGQNQPVCMYVLGHGSGDCQYLRAGNTPRATVSTGDGSQGVGGEVKAAEALHLQY